MAYFINNPINRDVKSTSLSNVTFHRVVATISVGGMSFKQSIPVNHPGDTVTFDISSSLRAYAESLAVDAVSSSKAYSAFDFSVSFTDEYMSGGKAMTTGDVLNRTYGFSGTAMIGGYTDRERLNASLSANTAESASLTLRPSSQMIVPQGHSILMLSIQGNTRHASMTDSVSAGCFHVDDNGRFYDFQFINSRGINESAFAQSYSSESIKGGTTTHVKSLRETFRTMSRRINVNDPSYTVMTFSSGFVDIEWARWWSFEFAKSKQHWILLDGIWIPCAITVKDGASIINRTKTELLSVEFECIPDINGML